MGKGVINKIIEVDKEYDKKSLFFKLFISRSRYVANFLRLERLDVNTVEFFVKD